MHRRAATSCGHTITVCHTVTVGRRVVVGLVLRMDNGPELISQALQSFCAGQVGLCYIPPALGYLTPAEYAAQCSHTHYPAACDIN